MRASILDGNYEDVGVCLRENWELKKALAAGISTPVIDGMVEKAHSAGVTGCKVSGAGGGGFLLTACARERKQAVRQAMVPRRELPFFLERCGSKVIFNMESYEWK